MSDTASPPIVGIGASAGGLEAIEAFFNDLPERTGLAFVVIQHLSPDFKSYMTEILSRKTAYRVVAAEDQMEVEPDTVYMLQPNNNLVISNGRLIVQFVERSRVPNRPIDLFFHSLSQEKGPEAIGVILSGTGSDGALGVKTIHESGGLVLVEAPEAAAFDGMPEAAIATNAADYIGEPAELAKWILQNPRRPQPVLTEKKATDAQGSQQRILEAIESKYDVDFSKYKMGTVGRRIDKRTQLLGITDLNAYRAVVEDDPRELSALYYQILIGVTQFFRDPEAFSVIENLLLPRLLGGKNDGADLRVWVPGCASGEEAFSLAIVIAEYLAKNKRRINWRIFATDIDDENLARASDGVYSEESLAAVNAGRRARWFTKQGDKYLISSELRSHVLFARHNLLRDPPFTKLDLVSCRNLLIYFGDEAQRTVLSLIYFALKSNGYLFLGPSESLGRSEPAYNIINARWKIYSKIKDAWRKAHEPIALTAPKRGGRRVIATRSMIERKQRHDVNAGLEQLLQAYVPPSFLVTHELDIVHGFGDAGQFLEMRPGAAEFNLKWFVDKRLADTIRLAARRALDHRETVALKGATTQIRGKEVKVDVTVRPLESAHDGRQGHLLVTFKEESSESPPLQEASTTVSVASTPESMAALEQELQLTRETLQATIEELETTNEELQSTNEELLSSNEELQSTNEELHSVNEELYTVNSEHQRKIEELTQLTRDEENLLRATDIGTVFLDDKLRIRKYTPAAARAFHLLPPDVGRPIQHINHTIRHDDLLALAQSVLDGGEPIEKEVDSESGTRFLMRMLPYAVNTEVTGVVISFVDISQVVQVERQLREQNEELEKQRNALRNLQESINDGYWDWHLQEDYEYMSPRLWQMLGYDPEEKTHHPSEWQKIIHPDDLGVSQDNFQEHVATRGEHPYDQDVRYRHKDGHWMNVRCRGRVVEWDDAGQPVRMVGTHTDITKVTAMSERHRLVTEGASVGIWDWVDVNGDELLMSSRFASMLGFKDGELEASFAELIGLVHPGDKDGVVEAVKLHLEEQEPFDIEFRLRTKAQGYIWVRNTGMASRDPGGNACRMVGAIQDIHEQKVNEERLKRANDDLRQFAYAASHDLRAPLRHIRSFAALLDEKLKDRLTDEEQKFMRHIREGGTKLSDLLEGLLRFSRLENGKEPESEVVALNDVVSEARRMLANSIAGVDADVSVHPLPTVTGDSALLTQVFLNLIDNAIKFREPTRPLVIEIDAEGCEDGVTVRVKDNGIGIAEADKTRVFRIFQQVKAVDAGGTGVGLTVVKTIAERTGVRVSIDSEPGVGTTFSLIFTPQHLAFGLRQDREVSNEKHTRSTTSAPVS